MCLFVFRGKAWAGEQSAANHDAGQLGVSPFHFADLRNACNVAVIDERMFAFAVEPFERTEVESSLVLLLAEPRVERDEG